MNNRLARYEVRDDYHGYYNGIGNKIYEHKFCTVCKNLVCADLTHKHIELHPILRIPKKSASKKKWDTFLGLIDNIGLNNIRSKRH